MNTTYKNHKPIKVLIVDDTHLILTAEKMIFETAGCEAETATNGFEALKLINNDIKLVLTDIQMPGMRGDQLAKKIRKKYPNVLVIGITATFVEALKEIDQSSLHALLQKPLQITTCHQLLNKINQMQSIIAA